MAEQTVETRFRDVEATHDQMPPLPKPIRVTGEYRLNRRSGACELRVASPPGSNPRILLLNLVITHGDGGDWVPVEGRFDAESNAYDSVQIVDEDGESVSAEIEIVS